MNEENPSFYAIIPANVRYAKITPSAKLLYGEITALCNKNGVCYASNDYFAKLYDVSKVSISKWIKELIDNGFITSEIIRDSNKQILNRYIRIVYDPIKENFNTPIKEKFNTPIKEKFKENNTYINNTYKIKENIIKEKKPVETGSSERSISVPENECNEFLGNTSETNTSIVCGGLDKNKQNREFEEWWRLYPRRISKGDAQKRYEKVIKDKLATEKELLDGVRKYNDYIHSTKTEIKYVKHPSTWLNQSCWLDDYSTRANPMQSTEEEERAKLIAMSENFLKNGGFLK